MNEKIKLKNNKEYTLALYGISSTPDTLHLLIQTEEPLEDLTTTFSDVAATERIITINKDGGVLGVYDGYTALNSKKSVDDHYPVVPAVYNGTGAITTPAVYGRAVTIKLSRPAIEEKVERNRADIDFLAVMAGTNI